jgi:hypothetical protein
MLVARNTPAQPVETTPRPTPISRKGTDRGIGGTGLNDDRGIGGTGSVGPITKFGGVFVNTRRHGRRKAPPGFDP